VKAVNLIPGDYRGGRASGAGRAGTATYGLLGALAVALGLVTIYVVTSNSVADQRSKLASLQQQLPQLQAEAAQLAPYTRFASMAQARAQTVQQIAATRFDWAQSLDQLSKVVPANTSLATLSASTNAAAASSGGSQSRGVPGDPTFQLHGCTGSQDDVARLMSRLRVMNGVVRVSLSNAGKASGGTSTSATPAGSSATSGAGTCGTGSSFDLTVSFQAPAGVQVPAGATSHPAATASGGTQ
jgi:Tfp pilus assembly protein PilN